MLILEEHSSVLPEWWCRSIRGRTLIYLDAHLDLQHVSGQRLEALRRCTTKEAVKRLEKPHHLLPDQSFSYSLEDFLYPAHRLGLIGRVIWVAPPHVKTEYSREILDRLQQLEGVRMEDLASFRRSRGGWVEGTLLGLPIALCNYRQLENMALPADCLFDIDTDYFVAIPGDELWVDPAAVFRALSALPLKPELITLSRSVSSGFMPLRYRFVADYLAALWEDRHEEAAHYGRLCRLDAEMRAGNHEAAVAGCNRELESHPRCAATHYLLSLSQRSPQPASEHQREAENLCAAYRANMLRSACEIPGRHLPLNLASALRLEERLGEEPLDPMQLALARVALGLIYCACREVDRACSQYEEGRQHPELGLEIGKLLLENAQAERAMPFLEAALADDKTRAAAHVFLAQSHRAGGSLAQALEHLEAAHELTPAWLDLLAMLADLHRQLGDAQRSRILLERHRQQQAQTERCARAIG